jgi:hypothetical protein
MLFALILTAEMYIMINFPNLIIVLAVMVVVDLACLYVVIDGMVDLQRQRTSRQEEQYDGIFKSQKASYLMLKKYFEEIGIKFNELEAAVDLPREELVNAQKGIAKVIINRSHEDSQALMNSYEILRDQIDEFQKEVQAVTHAMNSNYEEALELQRNTESSAEDAIQSKVKDLLLAIKDMEIRLNGAILQMQGNVVQTTGTQQISVQEPDAERPKPTEKDVPKEEDETKRMETEADLDQELDEAVRMELGEKPEKKAAKAEKQESEATAVPDEVALIEEELGLGSTEETVFGSEAEKVEEASQEMEVSSELEAEEETKEEEAESVEEAIAELEKNEEYAPEGIAALKSIMEFEPEEPDEYKELLGMESLMTPQTGSLTAILEESDKQQAAAESAAELEKPAGETIEEAEKPTGETVEEPEKPKAEKAAPKKKSKSSAKKKAEKETEKEQNQMPDLSDPNKSLSPDEIAALFSNMGT